MKTIRIITILLSIGFWLTGSVDAKPQSRAVDSSAPLALSTRIIKEAKFDGIDRDGSFRFTMSKTASTEAESQSFRPTEFEWWGGPINRLDQPIVQLNDDSILSGFVADWNNQSCRIISNVWQEFSVPQHHVSSILFYLPENTVARQVWLDRLNSKDSPKRIADRVWTRRGDILDGKIEKLTSDSVSLNIGGQYNRLSLDAVALIEFAPRAGGGKKSEFKATHQFYFSDGTRLNVNQIDFSDQQVNFTSKWGRSQLTLRNKGSEKGIAAQQLVCGFRALGQEGDFLSSRKPNRYQHQPLLGSQINYRNNRNLNDTTMELLQVEPPLVAIHGIAAPSRSSLIYQLAEPASSIQFGVALNTVEANQSASGHVACKVLGLNKENQWKVIWEQDVSAANVFYVHLPLKEISAVALAVDYGQGADVADRVNWLMPRLVR